MDATDMILEVSPLSVVLGTNSSIVVKVIIK